MTTLDPGDYMAVADILEQMYENEIPWPDEIYASSSYIELKYYNDNADD